MTMAMAMALAVKCYTTVVRLTLKITLAMNLTGWYVHGSQMKGREFVKALKQAVLLAY